MENVPNSPSTENRFGCSPKGIRFFFYYFFGFLAQLDESTVSEIRNKQVVIAARVPFTGKAKLIPGRMFRYFRVMSTSLRKG